MPVRSRLNVLSTLCAPALAALLAGGCSTSPPVSHFTRLWVDGTTGTPRVGTSTEDGVLLIAEPQFQVGDLFEIQFPVGNSLVRDWGRIDRVNENMAVIRPITARLREGRIATELPQPGEQLYLALRDDRDEPEMQPVSHWMDGAFGDWIVLTEGDSEQIASDYRGTALYVDRSGRWQIVGVLAGLIARDESDPNGRTALGYLGLLELSRILPDRVFYLEREVRPLRPDFEFGVPLQPGDIELDPPIEGAPATAPDDASIGETPPAPTVVPAPKPKPKPKPKPPPKPPTGGGAPRARA